jgi:hypothetical protein
LPHDNATILSTLLAIECVCTALPSIPLLRPKELMEFREQNAQDLRTFRRSMLRYAADLNDQLGGLDRRELETKMKFFVQTEVGPSLDELRDSINAPDRPWYKRLTEGLALQIRDPRQMRSERSRPHSRLKWRRRMTKIQRQNAPGYSICSSWKPIAGLGGFWGFVCGYAPNGVAKYLPRNTVSALHGGPPLRPNKRSTKNTLSAPLIA